jgi:hypothetical protein
MRTMLHYTNILDSRISTRLYASSVADGIEAEGTTDSVGGEDGKFGGSVCIGEIDCTGETDELSSTRG